EIEGSISMNRKGARKRARALRTGRTRDWIDLTGAHIGNWEVAGYAGRNDHDDLDIDWTDYFWEARCVACNTLAILERRQIIGRRQKQCVVCVERERIGDEIVRLQQQIFDQPGPIARNDRLALKRLSHNRMGTVDSVHRIAAHSKTMHHMLQHLGLNSKMPRVADMACLRVEPEVRSARDRQALKVKLAKRREERLRLLGVPSDMHDGWPSYKVPFGEAVEAVERRSNGETWSAIAQGKGYSGPTIAKAARFLTRANGIRRRIGRHGER
ncbi:MAG: hypothetical protein ACR2PG_23730, partial [Hyphomicrobiaceae bacterium]